MNGNMLVIMSDEHQSRAMGCAGHSFDKTPNLDRLAARGMRFTNAYTPSPICVPAHAAFATGRYLHQNRLWNIANKPYDSNRVVFCEYHAIGAVSGVFMIRKGQWKYNYYVGFEPELFNLQEDPEETLNVAESHADIVALLHAELLQICDPNAVDELAHTDQQALVKSYGGREAALKLGAPGAKPPPNT